MTDEQFICINKSFISSIIQLLAFGGKSLVIRKQEVSKFETISLRKRHADQADLTVMLGSCWRESNINQSHKTLGLSMKNGYKNSKFISFKVP